MHLSLGRSPLDSKSLVDSVLLYYVISADFDIILSLPHLCSEGDSKALPTQHYVTLYKLPSFDSVDDFLRKVATVRGKLKKGGVVDVEATARIVLHDWN